MLSNSATAFRAKLGATPACTMQFNIIPSPVVTQAMASAGADVICIDMEVRALPRRLKKKPITYVARFVLCSFFRWQHGPIDFKDAQAMIAATQGTGALPVYAYADLSVSCRSGVGGDMAPGAS